MLKSGKGPVRFKKGMGYSWKFAVTRIGNIAEFTSTATKVILVAFVYFSDSVL